MEGWQAADLSSSRKRPSIAAASDGGASSRCEAVTAATAARQLAQAHGRASLRAALSNEGPRASRLRQELTALKDARTLGEIGA